MQAWGMHKSTQAQSPTMEDRLMKKLLYVGIDVHKESIVMACAGRGGKGTWHHHCAGCR